MAKKKKNRLPRYQQERLVHNFNPLNDKQEEFVDMIMDKEVTICKGPSGSGKAQPLYSTIYTPNGPITMGEAKIGVEVCTPDGKSAFIDGVFPQGIKDYYRIHFSDKTFVDCCGEHLWKVFTINDRCSDSKHGTGRFTIAQTKEMIGSVLKKGKKNYKLPVTNPVYYKKRLLPLEPYLLGALLGDGGMTGTSTMFTSKDSEIIEHVRNSVSIYGLEINPTKATLESRAYDYTIAQPNRQGQPSNYITQTTREMGLRCKSEFKFIPKDYLYSSLEDRIALMQGLMDTDGTVDKKSGCPSLSTSSVKLRDDFCELVRSLGGIATISIKKTKCLDNFIININLPNDILPFRLTRKAELVKLKTKYLTPRFITEIEYIGEIEQQCISVDSEEHLYLTDNHIVTHNTYCALAKALELLEHGYKQIILVKSMTTVKEEAMGFLPGGADEKMDPYVMSFTWTIDKLCGEGASKSLMDKKLVSVMPIAFTRGISIDNSIVIIDEVQNLSFTTFKTLITRIGQNSKYILMGDVEQIDRRDKKESPLEKIYDIFETSEEVGTIEFKDEHCVRNEIIPVILKKLRDHGI